VTYALNDESAGAYAENLRVVEGSYVFDLSWKNERLDGLQLNVGGLHNVENMVAAVSVALHLDIEREKIRKAVASFRGVKRRFEYILKNDIVFIDDYAHHPEELRSLIKSVKMLYPNRKAVVVFQPHLFSRTKDLADGFAEVLDMADEVMLLPIYPARELPVEGVTSKLISDRMRGCETGHKVRLVEKEDVLKWVEQNKGSMGKNVLVTAGAGDIDRMIEPIKKTLTV